MDGVKIRKKIISLNTLIEKSIDPTSFVLNEKVQKARAEIEYLRRICQHEYDDLGYCIYCDKRKK